MTNTQEKYLVQQIRKGNGSAFEKLYHSYFPKIYNFSFKLLKNKEEAEEVAQDVFKNIWVNKERLDENLSFQGLLFKAAKNLIQNIWRKNLNNELYIKEVVSGMEEGKKTTDEIVEYNDIKKIIDNNIEMLPQKRKQIFLLSREKGLSYKEIARELKISENTVDTQIRNALNFLREHLKKYTK